MRTQADTKHAWLFDIDGVLCEPQQVVSDEIIQGLISLKTPLIFYVSGNPFLKCLDMMNGVIYVGVFSNNSDELRGFRGEPIWQDTETPPLPFIEDFLQQQANASIEWRSPRFVNYCPIGRYATQDQRKNHDTSWRIPFTMELMDRYEVFGVDCSIGGQVSVDVYSKGADKSRAGKWLNDNGYTFTFIGDKTAPGGNDYPLAEYCRLHPENKCLTSTGPKHTLELIDLELRNE